MLWGLFWYSSFIYAQSSASVFVGKFEPYGAPARSFCSSDDYGRLRTLPTSSFELCLLALFFRISSCWLEIALIALTWETPPVSLVSSSLITAHLSSTVRLSCCGYQGIDATVLISSIFSPALAGGLFFTECVNLIITWSVLPRSPSDFRVFISPWYLVITKPNGEGPFSPVNLVFRLTWWVILCNRGHRTTVSWIRPRNTSLLSAKIRKFEVSFNHKFFS